MKKHGASSFMLRLAVAASVGYVSYLLFSSPDSAEAAAKRNAGVVGLNIVVGGLVGL